MDREEAARLKGSTSCNYEARIVTVRSSQMLSARRYQSPMITMEKNTKRRFKLWLFRDVKEGEGPHEREGQHQQHPWWQVMRLTCEASDNDSHI